MTRQPARSAFSTVAAFLAVAFLAFAGVKSTVMQAQMAQVQAQSLCGPGLTNSGDMAGMEMAKDGGGARHDPAKSAAHRACDFCSAAAHAPLLSFFAAFHAPTAVAFAAPFVTASLGPRGPPSFRPTATGPPTFLTI